MATINSRPGLMYRLLCAKRKTKDVGLQLVFVVKRRQSNSGGEESLFALMEGKKDPNGWSPKIALRTTTMTGQPRTAAKDWVGPFLFAA